MIILKSQVFGTAKDVAKFINVNNIKREDILTITTTSINAISYAVFFYGDEATEEITRGFFGWKD